MGTGSWDGQTFALWAVGSWVPLHYGVNPVATAPPMPTAVSEPVASSFTYTSIHQRLPLRYAEGYQRPSAGVHSTYIPSSAMPAPGFASLSGLRGPESCRGRTKGSRRSSNRPLPRSEIEEALRSATGELVADMTQKIRNKLEPLIPPDGSPMTIRASPHQVQANHLVAGLTHTLGVCEKSTYADPCSRTTESLRAKNCPAAL